MSHKRYAQTAGVAALTWMPSGSTFATAGPMNHHGASWNVSISCEWSNAVIHAHGYSNYVSFFPCRPLRAELLQRVLEVSMTHADWMWLPSYDVVRVDAVPVETSEGRAQYKKNKWP
jgi:hypothetical protein